MIEISSTFKPNKSTGPSKIPTKIRRLIKDDVSEHLSIAFNMSISIGILQKLSQSMKGFQTRMF